MCAAFYGDCRHEVTPVTSGYRVVLTFVLRTAARAVERAPAVAAGVTERLASEVRAHFDAPVRPKYGADERRPKPDRLVFLLDHEYTSRGLDWTRLKNGDALRAAALRDAADRIDCDVRLALADVHESWMCETDYDPRRWSRRGHRGRAFASYDDAEGVTNDDGYRTDDPAHPELVDLYETQVELRDPGDASARGRKALERVDFEDEVCWLRPSSEVRPFQWLHEGYTGNAGDTVDRWYHRGAVVLTPRSRRFVLLAKRSPARAVADLERVLRGREPARAEPDAARDAAELGRGGARRDDAGASDRCGTRGVARA